MSTDRRRCLGVIVGRCDAELWHLPQRRRQRRVLGQLGIGPGDIAGRASTVGADCPLHDAVIDGSGGVLEVPDADALDLALASVSSAGLRCLLLLRSDYLFEPRTLAILVDRNEPSIMVDCHGRIAAALAPTDSFEVLARAMLDDGGVEPGRMRLHGLPVVHVDDFPEYDGRLRRTAAPVLQRIEPGREAELEARLYGSAYKGVTDAITKWIWPRPSALLVRICARLEFSPNQVTFVSLVLTIAAGYLFLKGSFWSGLALAWLMTLLDTVDGKLARVTVRSSVIGDRFDHGIDLVHPPFWYLAWALGVQAHGGLNGHAPGTLAMLIFVPYVAGRLSELGYTLCCSGSLFLFKPFDSWFRLITARRNPNLVILTASMLAGRPDIGVLSVIAWSAFSTVVQFARLADGIRARRAAGAPLLSWMAREPCRQRHPISYRLFASTRNAFIR